MTPSERERARQQRLKGDPEFEAKRVANYSRQNKRRRADPEIAERMREANRVRMAAKRADEDYRRAAVEKVRAIRERRRLDAEFEQFLSRIENENHDC